MRWKHCHVFEYRQGTLMAHELLPDVDITVCGRAVHNWDDPDQDIWYGDHDRDDVALCRECGTESPDYMAVADVPSV